MSNPPSAPRNQIGLWFALLSGTVLAGEALGYAACALQGVFPPDPGGLAVFIVVALLAGGVATTILNWQLLHRHGQLLSEVEELRSRAAAGQDYQAKLASRAEQQRRLRHDIRGALSPALLTADRLLGHADPAVKRAGEIMVRSVDRAALLLADPPDAEPSPRADP